MADRFVAIDFETANADLASICQIGAVTFERGVAREAWGTLVNPEDYFDEINVSIHGIDERKVRKAPIFPKISGALAARVGGQVVVSHTSFDRVALSQALTKYQLEEIPCTWLDSARVARRAWTEFARVGYGLNNVCGKLGIEYQAHDAVEDARAAGEVLLRAMKQTGLDLPGWLARVKTPIDPEATKPIAYDGNPDGPLFGEEIVFTGALTLRRREAAALAAKAGCDVAPGVKKSTTLLVVGDQDVRKLAGHEKSAKHRKAERLIANGQRIRILRESDFVRLIDMSH